MLCLGRAANERIIIQTPDGSEIIVRVAEITRNFVRLSFEAPGEVRIVREEILAQKRGLTLPRKAADTAAGAAKDSSAPT